MTYRTATVDEFLDGIAAETVAPAGGTATAVVGAIGTSLCEMVCIHTIEHDAYPDVADEVTDLREELTRQRSHLLDLADADAEVVDELFPTGGGELSGSDVKRSIGVPLTIAEACGTVLDASVEVTATGNRKALADAATGVILVRAAVRAAVFTVRRNLDTVADQSYRDDVMQQLASIQVRADDASEEALRQIEARS
jgi:formiminotetrahydrofolate cyclodeaminase